MRPVWLDLRPRARTAQTVPGQCNRIRPRVGSCLLLGASDEEVSHGTLHDFVRTHMDLEGNDAANLKPSPWLGPLSYEM